MLHYSISCSTAVTDTPRPQQKREGRTFYLKRQIEIAQPCQGRHFQQRPQGACPSLGRKRGTVKCGSHYNVRGTAQELPIFMLFFSTPTSCSPLSGERGGHDWKPSVRKRTSAVSSRVQTNYKCFIDLTLPPSLRKILQAWSVGV